MLTEVASHRTISRWRSASRYASMSASVARRSTDDPRMTRRLTTTRVAAVGRFLTAGAGAAVTPGVTACVCWMAALMVLVLAGFSNRADTSWSCKWRCWCMRSVSDEDEDEDDVDVGSPSGASGSTGGGEAGDDGELGS